MDSARLSPDGRWAVYVQDAVLDGVGAVEPPAAIVRQAAVADHRFLSE